MSQKYCDFLYTLRNFCQTLSIHTVEEGDSLYARIAELEARITILEKVCEELEGEIEELQDMYLKVDPKLKYF